MYASLLRICAPYIWIFLLCRLIPTLYEIINELYPPGIRYRALIIDSDYLHVIFSRWSDQQPHFDGAYLSDTLFSP